METSIGVNLRVTAHSNQGGRKYMEDMFCVAYQPTADDRDLLYAYFGILDGHGGREAALYAKHHLMDHIVNQKNFWADDDELVLKAIREGFITTHHAMWKELEKWPKTPSGLPSTSGTTASIAFVRRGKLYIGHVGDSGIVLGYEDPENGFWRAKPLTRDHKPESPDESSRITEAGGKVVVKSGVPRVVWNRPRIGHKGPVRRSTLIDEIPFLAVARSLGDLWSYNSEQDQFVVSPQPDVSVLEIDVHSHRCLILGTDGLWNMLNPQEAVNSVYFAEKNNERQPQGSPGSCDPLLSKGWINPSKRLVDRALDRWQQNNLRADNTSVVTVVVDPPGPPKRSHAIRHSFSSTPEMRNAPGGISRYFPPKPSIPLSRTMDHQSTPASSAFASSVPTPSCSGSRMVSKSGHVLDSSPYSSPSSAPRSSRAKSSRLTDKARRGSIFTPTRSYPQYSDDNDLGISSPSDGPASNNEIDTSSTSKNEIQINEISSSSETKKVGVIVPPRKSRKRKAPPVSPANTKKKKGTDVCAPRRLTRMSSHTGAIPAVVDGSKRESESKVKVPSKSATPEVSTSFSPKRLRSSPVAQNSRSIRRTCSSPIKKSLKSRHHDKPINSGRKLRSTTKFEKRSLRSSNK